MKVYIFYSLASNGMGKSRSKKCTGLRWVFLGLIFWPLLEEEQNVQIYFQISLPCLYNDANVNTLEEVSNILFSFSDC